MKSSASGRLLFPVLLMLVAARSGRAADPEPTAVPAVASDASEDADGETITPAILRKRLLGRAEIDVDKVPLKDLLKKLSNEHAIPIRLDEKSLAGRDVTPDSLISQRASGTLNTVLKKCLKGLGLRAVVLQKEVLITTADSEAAPAADVEDAHGGQDAAKKARPARAARAAQADRQLEQQIDQQAQQFIRQFAALHHAELFFLTEMCGTDPQIVAKLKENGDARVKAAARAYAATQQRMMRQPNERTGFADPRGLIQEEIHKELKSLASPEQLATYESQVARRAKARRSAAVRNLVSKLDRDLVLSAEQRAKLLETLLDRWDDSWGRVMQLFIYGDQYFPSVPDELVAPHLNATQMEIWRSIPKHNQSIFFSGLGLMGNEIEDFPWDGEAALNEANGAVRVEAVEAVETAVPDKEEAGGAP